MRTYLVTLVKGSVREQFEIKARDRTQVDYVAKRDYPGYSVVSISCKN
jgi:hypothetical protein